MKFCSKCGAALGPTAKPPATRIAERGPRRPDILGFVSAGVIIIIMALAYIRNPIAPSVIIDYFESMGNQGTFLKPPLILLDAAIFFFYATGVWGIILSALRIVLERNARKAFGDLVGGFFSFFCAFLLTNYAADVFAGRITLAYFVVGIGLLVIVNAIAYFLSQKGIENSLCR